LSGFPVGCSEDPPKLFASLGFRPDRRTTATPAVLAWRLRAVRGIGGVSQHAEKIRPDA
jgi:hypothetical protein